MKLFVGSKNQDETHPEVGRDNDKMLRETVSVQAREKANNSSTLDEECLLCHLTEYVFGYEIDCVDQKSNEILAEVLGLPCKELLGIFKEIDMSNKGDTIFKRNQLDTFLYFQECFAYI
jgi:hypothetical protein